MEGYAALDGRYVVEARSVRGCSRACWRDDSFDERAREHAHNPIERAASQISVDHDFALGEHKCGRGGRP